MVPKGKREKSIRQNLAAAILKTPSLVKRVTEKQFLLALIAFDFCLRFWRIWEPSKPYFDEGLYYLKAAKAYLAGVATLNPEHPPLAKLIMAASIKLFGDNPIGWRLPGVLLGTIGILVTYFLAKRLTGSKRIAALSAVFLSFEFSWFVASRVATIEIYLASFLLIGSFFVIRLYQDKKLINIIPAGLFLGAALASKWSAILLIVWLGIFLGVFWKEKLRTKVVALIGMGEIIFWIYLASYLPYLRTHTPKEVVELHKWMLSYHNQLIPRLQREAAARHHYDLQSHAWIWLFNPTFPLYGRTFGQESTKAILFLFNPMLFWGSLIGWVLLLKEQFGKGWKKLKPETIFLLGAFGVQFFPWLLVQRLTFNYYLLSSMPFLSIIFSIFVYRLWKKGSAWFYALSLVVVLAFLIYYPLLSALKVPYLYSRIITGVVRFVD